jgi:hypothetical protein
MTKVAKKKSVYQTNNNFKYDKITRFGKEKKKKKKKRGKTTRKEI